MTDPCRRVVAVLVFASLFLFADPQTVSLFGERTARGSPPVLLSALVSLGGNRDVQVPSTMRLTFYLSRRVPVSVDVRSLDVTRSYNCRLCQKETLGPGSFTKTWPGSGCRSAPNGLKMYSMGALVRIDQTAPAGHEWIAPAALYRTRASSRVQGYDLTFQTRRDASIATTFLHESGRSAPGSPLAGQSQPMRVLAGKPFTIHMDCPDLGAGDYKLVVRAMSAGGEPVVRTIHFYHRQDVISR